MPWLLYSGEREPVPEAGWALWSVWKILHSLGFKPQTIQPIASHFTNHTILERWKVHTILVGRPKGNFGNQKYVRRC